MVFCNKTNKEKKSYDLLVTILILIDGFLQYNSRTTGRIPTRRVTILILIDGFLQFDLDAFLSGNIICHNPYFNRWFSAIIIIIG